MMSKRKTIARTATRLQEPELANKNDQVSKFLILIQKVNEAWKKLNKELKNTKDLVLPTDNFVEGVAYPKEELEAVFDNDFQIALTSAEELLEEIEVPETIKGVIVEMCFQLGKPRVMKFKRMWEGLEAGDYNKSADEMIDSNWHKQTTARCESLAELVRGCA